MISHKGEMADITIERAQRELARLEESDGERVDEVFTRRPDNCTVREYIESMTGDPNKIDLLAENFYQFVKYRWTGYYVLVFCRAYPTQYTHLYCRVKKWKHHFTDNELYGIDHDELKENYPARYLQYKKSINRTVRLILAIIAEGL
jgi:hypothetical protein